MLVGAADTSTPDPDYLPGSGFFPIDPLIMHAFQWHNGVLTDLGALPGNNNSFATWTSPNGLIAGFSENGVIDPQFNVPQVDAVLWKGGEIIDLGGYFSAAAAVNSRGQVVGTTLNTATLPALNVRAFLWQTGTMRDLGTLGGDQAFAYFVNERGQVSGSSFTNSNPNPTQDPFLWEDGTMQDLGTLGGTFGVPNALNNRGQVVGQSNLTGDASFHPFLWEKRNNPQLADLGTLGGNFGSAFWINDAGEVVGWATTAGDRSARAFLWKNGVMTNLGTLNGEPCAFAQSINSKHQVVGVAFDCVTAGGHAWLWENDGPIVDLNTLVPREANLTLELAENINDRGEISGIGSPPDCRDPFVCGHAFLLIPCHDDHSGEPGCEDEDEVRTSATQNSSMTANQDHIVNSMNPVLTSREIMARTQSRFGRIRGFGGSPQK
jgi:probable HAF family extracellular repeat protein